MHECRASISTPARIGKRRHPHPLCWCRTTQTRAFDTGEIALALDLGKRTVERDSEKARSVLYAALKRG